MHRSRVSARYSFVESSEAEHLESFADEVAAGLSQPNKRLPCRFFYDADGSSLFEDICALPEYYVTRAEREILERHADDIAAQFDEPVSLAELGSGSSAKTRLLIEALLRRQGELRYVPVDISRRILDESARELLDDYTGLEIFAIASEYRDGLRHVRRETHRPKLIAWLGSNVGNFDRTEAARFVRSIRDAMTPDDRLLLGVDLRKDRTALEAAYDDAQGVTARFNKNLLVRINEELDGDVDLSTFEHRATWHPGPGRVSMELVSTCDQDVEIQALDQVVRFRAGEAIHTEDSYKYSEQEIATLAEEAGLRVRERWLDSGSRFSLNLLDPA
jgi:dimethylhistidine N-methyltransferase